MSQSTTPPPLERQTALIERFTTASAQGWQQAWDWWSERSNPIVVKEARQSLNSNQFVICFGITLVAVLLWTMYSVFSQLPNAYYLPGGLLVLTGYFVILSFPLILVIPFSAYRSMMLEAESRTFELVSISGLSAKQIVQGKMSSACLQIAIYLSAMLPCIVITYLLRGISVSTILIYLYFMVIASVVLSAIAIMIATVSRQRFLQVFSNLFILGMQLVLFYVVCAATIAFVYSFPMMSWVNAPVIMSIGTIALTTVPLCMQCSAAAIDFPSENHAVAVRSRFLVWIGTIFFWCAWVVVTTETAGHWVWIYSVLLAIFLVVGALCVSERGILSPRAQRTLPRTLLGQCSLTWFYPGAGLAYVFLTSLFASIVIGVIGFAYAFPLYSAAYQEKEETIAVGVAALSYFILYTGLTRLIMMSVPRHIVGRPFLGLFMQAFLFALVPLLPYFILLALHDFRSFDYGWHQLLFVSWTIRELDSGGFSSVNTRAIVLLAALSGIVFLINLLMCGRDVLLLRVELPPRVQQELAATRTPKAPVESAFD